MSNRPKLKKLKEKLSQDEAFRRSIAKLAEMVNESLNQMSPGAYYETGSVEGEFWIHTPSQKLMTRSISLLGIMLNHSTAGYGEQALINAVNRVNKILPFTEELSEPMPEEQQYTIEEFLIALENGLDRKLEFWCKQLLEYPEGSAEGDIIGYVQGQSLMSRVTELKARLEGRNGRLEVLVGKEWLPIHSPTVLGFIFKYVKVNDHETLIRALTLTAFITASPLFQEWAGVEPGGGPSYFPYSSN